MVRIGGKGMKKHPYSFSEFSFRENNAAVITQQFEGSIKIEGFTENGSYKFEYKEYETEEINK
jgi:hypothetical protein